MIRKGIVHKLAFYVCATVIGFLNMMPFFWMISTSLNDLSFPPFIYVYRSIPC
jgi:ABC-type glycerol-3-phosphate transport system permease component